ncbi:autophagy- protein 2 [Coemansia sp. BCRC 34301]|nr:autophagy- protein 2 [Coemansia sp. BCRC 34301]
MWPSSWSVSLPSWAVSNTLQKRLVKFLLRRTVGQFLKTELDDEHLDVQLSSGQLRLKNVELSEEATGLPVSVRSGVVGTVLVSVPWTQLWTGHCELIIEDLVLKTELVDDDAYNDGSVSDNDGNNAGAATDYERSRFRSGHSNMADSIAMTEGGASILTSPVFIADDFLRAETLGYGEKDAIFINKDVERLVANAHEERAHYYRRQRRRGAGEQEPSPAGKRQASSKTAATGQQRPSKPQTPISDSDNADDEFEDCTGGLPLPGSPGGGPVRGLQVVSEMVERIVSAINISVRNVKVECAVVAAHDDKCAHDMTVPNTLQLTIDSIGFMDDKASRDASSGLSTESPSRRSRHSSSSSRGGDSGSENSGSSHDHPTGIEYKVVELRTLHKLLEIKGLRLAILTPSETGDVQCSTVVSAFSTPTVAHLRIHRRLPFSELAPVHPKDSSNRRHRGSGNDDSVYMGPMPGEFREAKLGQSPAPSAPADLSSAGGRIRNNSGEEPMTSGWDISFDVGDLACVVTERQLASIAAMALVAAPLFSLKAERKRARSQYWYRFGEKQNLASGDVLPQLARWVSMKCKHVYVAVVPQTSALLDGWQDGSLAILRLKLETTKHLALYLKGIGAKWESSPRSGTQSAPSGSTVYMDTNFWADTARESAMYTKDELPAGTGSSAGGDCTTTITAYLQSFSFYDNDPEVHPVVRPLATIDRSLIDAECQRERSVHASASARGFSKYDIWLRTTDSDGALTVNVGPVVVVLNKELLDRLLVYKDLAASIVSAGPVQPTTMPMTAAPEFNHHGFARDPVDSIENLMRNLKIQAEPKLPSNIAVCSPLIRTWVSLPSTASDSSKSQSRMHSKEEASAPGHFCVDAVDAVITNVVNGAAASSQSQGDVPEGHMRHPHIQELLESRKSVAGSGVRVECNALNVYVQAMEGSSAIEHIASVHSPSDTLASDRQVVSIPRPHIEITTVAKPVYHRHRHSAGRYSRQRPPAFDAFSAVDHDIRVRVAPESELTTSLEFERQAVAQSRLVVSCHLPEAEATLSRTTYQRLNAIINEFMVWQSVQEEATAATTATLDKGDGLGVDDLGISVLVDVPLVVATINTGDIHRQPGQRQAQEAESQRARLVNTQLFISNALVEKGRTYVSIESNQVRLSSFVDETETEAVLSHSFASPVAPIITPQLSLYMLSSPTITRESEIVLKTTWTTFDHNKDSTCFRDLEAFFSSSGTSGMVQPPPKPMRLSLNVLNSSFRWAPTSDPSICSAALSLDSLAVIVGINMPAPDRDREELHYYIEGLSVFGKSTDSLIAPPVDISSDAWVSTGRFWRDHGYSVLVHMDMVDLASKTREGDDGPLVDLKLYSEALILDACADSAGSLPLLLRGLLRDIKGSDNAKQDPAQPSKRRHLSPQVLGQTSADIFGEIDEDTFAAASAPANSRPHFPVLSPRRLSGHARTMSPRSANSQSFTRDFENGRDDIGALVLDEYFAVAAPHDAADEYEVIGNHALSPSYVAHPTYSRHSQQAAYMPSSLPVRDQVAGGSLARQPLDIRPSKDKSRDAAAAKSFDMFDAEEEDDNFDLGDYVNMDSDGDLLSEDEFGYSADFGGRPRGSRPNSGYRHSSAQRNRFPGQQFSADGSVVLEPGFSSPQFAAHRPTNEGLPRVLMVDNAASVGVDPVQVKVPATSDSSSGEAAIGVDRGFGVIDDYFKAPMPGDTAPEDDESCAGAGDHILCLAVDIARVQVNLYSGQDWFVTTEPALQQPLADPGFMPSYMDNLNDSASAMGGSIYGHTSTSMPESRGAFLRRNSSLEAPHGHTRPLPPRPARRSAKPKIELRATHVHAELKQFSESSATAYDFGLNVGMLEILDELESSEWSKFLTRRRDAKTGLPATLQSLANPRNRQLFTKGTADSDRVTSSPMRCQRSSRWPSNNAEPMICAHAESVRPYPTLATEELRIDVEISPLRCYIHQDALDFLIAFFEASERYSAALAANAESSRQGHELAAGTTAGGSGRRKVPERRGLNGHRQRSSLADHPYFQIVRIAPINLIFDYKPRRMRTLSGSSGSNHLQQATGTSVFTVDKPSVASAAGATASPVSPKAGPSRKPIELLNFFPLEDAEMTLNTVKVRGVAGVSKLVRELGRAWLPHLTQTQIPGVVSGMTPLRSLVNLGSGFADLVILPLEQYRKDGRLVQGIKRGAQSFARTTALEAIQLGAKVAVNAQTLLEQAGDIFNVDVTNAGELGSAPHSHDGAEGGLLHSSDHPHIVVDLADWPDYMSADGHSTVAAGSEYGGSSSGGTGRRSSFNRSKYARQPENLSEGMRQAYLSLRSNMGDAVQTILAIPVVVQESVGDDGGGDWPGDGAVSGRSPVHGSVRAVVRAVPVAVLKPMIGATEAVSKTLLGLRNTMEPARRGQLEDKYKSRSLGSKKSHPSS